MCYLRLMAVTLLFWTSICVGGDPEVPLEFLAIDNMGANVGTAQGPDGLPAIEVTGGTAARIVPLIDLDSTSVTSNRYSVRGRVKYDSVVGDGYLELWNDFGDNEKYFSRSLADLGPMGKLSGSSDWREFELSFFHQDGKTPKRLTLNVVLPSAGHVTVGQPRVVVFAATPKGWWTEMQSGLMGAFLGTLLGFLGALMGVTASFPRTRWISLWLCRGCLVLGIVSLAVGILGAVAQQPWYVYIPLLIVGGVCFTVFGTVLVGMSFRFRDDELRRLTAIDAI